MVKFKLHDKVRIIELERPGRIISIWETDKGTRYEVRYFYDGVAKEVYFYSDELEEM